MSEQVPKLPPAYYSAYVNEFTRQPHFYDGIAGFLKDCGIRELSSQEDNLTNVNSRPIEAVLPGGFVA